MGRETWRNPNTGNWEERETKSGEDVANAETAGKVGSLADAGVGKKEKITSKTPMPKQSDFPGDTAAWASALRKWRQEQDEDKDNKAQKDVLKDKAK